MLQRLERVAHLLDDVIDQRTGHQQHRTGSDGACKTAARAQIEQQAGRPAVNRILCGTGSGNLPPPTVQKHARAGLAAHRDFYGEPFTIRGSLHIRIR